MSRLRSYVPIIDELDRYCYASAVPILLDGRRVDGLVASRGLGLSESNRPLALLGLRELLHSPPHISLPEDFEEKVASLLSHPRRLARTYGGAREFQAALMLTARFEQGWTDLLGPRRRTQLLWLKDGLVVQEDLLELRTTTVGVTMFANADGLDTDLTGLGLLHNEEYRARRVEILAATATAMRDQRIEKAAFFREDQDSQSHTDREWDEQEAVRKRIKVLLKGSGTGLTLALLNPIIGIPTTVAAVGYTYARKPKPVDEKVRAGREKLEEVIWKEVSLLRQCLAELALPLDHGADESLKGP